MEAQYRSLLSEEISDFRSAASNHRMLNQFIGGCSNIAVFGPASLDGSLWHGRNFDFSGYGVLDRYRIIYIVEPEGKIPYVTISWSGPLPWNYQAVHTAMNAKGLTLGYMISQAPGESIMDTLTLWTLFRTVIENASTIEEAVAILEAGPRKGAANLLLADGKKPEAVVVEITSRAVIVRQSENGVIYSTNHFVSDELFNPENKDPDSLGRLEKLGELTARDFGSFDLPLTISVLRDRYDMNAERMALGGDIIATPANMISVVFHPADLTFWVANGSAPAAYRSFVGFSLQGELDGNQAQTSLLSVPVDASLDADAWAEVEAYQSGIRAYDQGDDAMAVEFLSKAVALDPNSARYRYGLAGALINLGRYDEAITNLESALTNDPYSAYRAYIYFRLGLIYERMGNTENKCAAFEKVLEVDVGDEEIERYARQALGQ